MPQNINSVVLVGNLTRDPELRHTPAGTAVTTLRIAVNDRVKRGEEWQDAAYYFDVTVWGRTAENCAQYLSKGRPVGVQGKLTWREWDAQDGTKRQSVEVVAWTTSSSWVGARTASRSSCPRAPVRRPSPRPRPPTTTSRSSAQDEHPRKRMLIAQHL